MKNLMLILLLAKISLFGASYAQAQMEMFSEPWIDVYLDTKTCSGEVDDVMLFSYAQAKFGGTGRDLSFKFAWPINDMSCYELDSPALWGWQQTCATAVAGSGFVAIGLASAGAGYLGVAIGFACTMYGIYQ